MYPILFELFGQPIKAYAVLILVAIAVGLLVRRSEKQRLGFDRDPRQRWVGLGALLGAAIGAKLGMILFEPLDSMPALLEAMLRFDLSGKTVVGGLIGGYIGVELTKKYLSVDYSTGDAFALALPLAQATGRIGCLLHGCCYGTPHHGPLAVELHGQLRHPVQLYESTALLALAAYLFWRRSKPAPLGELFRRYLVGYACIRFVTEFFRGDPVNEALGLSYVQWVCLIAALLFAALIVRKRASWPQDDSPTAQATPLTPGEEPRP